LPTLTPTQALAPAPVAVAPAAVVPTPAPATPAAELAKPSAPATQVAVPASPSSPPAVAPSTTSRGISPSFQATPANNVGTPAAAPLGSGPQSLTNMVINPLGTGGSPTTSGLPYVSRGRGGWNGDQLKIASDKLLNPNKRPENYEIEFEKAGKKDCMKEGSLQVVARLLNGDCPK
jgi:hypothetical protein